MRARDCEFESDFCSMVLRNRRGSRFVRFGIQGLGMNSPYFPGSGTVSGRRGGQPAEDDASACFLSFKSKRTRRQAGSTAPAEGKEARMSEHGAPLDSIIPAGNFYIVTNDFNLLPGASSVRHRRRSAWWVSCMPTTWFLVFAFRLLFDSCQRVTQTRLTIKKNGAFFSRHCETPGDIQLLSGVFFRGFRHSYHLWRI